MDNEFNNIDEALLLEDERIANYLKGRMTSEEEQAFIDELKANPELKSKAVAMARLVKGMKQVGNQRDEEISNAMLASDKSEIEEIAKDAIGGAVVVPFPSEDIYSETGKAASASTITPPVANKSSHSRKVATWLSMAASIALIIWAGFGYHDYRETTGLGAQYAPTITTDLTEGISKGSGESSEVETKLANLFNNVTNKTDLKNTLHELSLCWELSTQETYNDYTDFAPEIGWTLAIGYLRDNNRKQAKAVLEKLTDVAPAGTDIGDKARELLTKI